MKSPKYITKQELSTLNRLFSNRKIEKRGQKQLDEFWQLLSEKYHFHSDHALIHNETGEIVDNCTGL